MSWRHCEPVRAPAKSCRGPPQCEPPWDLERVAPVASALLGQPEPLAVSKDEWGCGGPRVRGPSQPLAGDGVQRAEGAAFGREERACPEGAARGRRAGAVKGNRVVLAVGETEDGCSGTCLRRAGHLRDPVEKGLEKERGEVLGLSR